jgi:hypothetical protein
MIFMNETLFYKGSVVTLVIGAIWATVSLFIAVDMGLQSTFALIIFVVMTLLVWILVPFYVKRIRPSFIVGAILLIAGLAGLFASPGNPPWYTFSNPISVVKELIFVVDVFLGVYFSLNYYLLLGKNRKKS